MNTLNPDGSQDRLGVITQLLYRAATQVWRDADQAAPDSPLHDLGLGLYLAHSQARTLLPEDWDVPDVDLDERMPLQLLTEAEELIRPLPQHHPDRGHASQLVVDVCDLIREARGLGY